MLTYFAKSSPADTNQTCDSFKIILISLCSRTILTLKLVHTVNFLVNQSNRFGDIPERLSFCCWTISPNMICIYYTFLIICTTSSSSSVCSCRSRITQQHKISYRTTIIHDHIIMHPYGNRSMIKSCRRRSKRLSPFPLFVACVLRLNPRPMHCHSRGSMC